jgi:hypothetical protein
VARRLLFAILQGPVARPTKVKILTTAGTGDHRVVLDGALADILDIWSLPISWPDPPGNISDEVMERLWREEREGR